MKKTEYYGRVEEDFKIEGPNKNGKLTILKASTGQYSFRLRYNPKMGEWEIENKGRICFDTGEEEQINDQISNAVRLTCEKFPCGPDPMMPVVLPAVDITEN